MKHNQFYIVGGVCTSSSTKGENSASPLWKPQWFCAHGKPRGIQITLLLLVTLLLYSHTVFAKVEVLSCEPEWKSLVEKLGGNHIEAYSATTALQDPHNIQARPSLIAKARRADLLVCTGAELETGWLPMLLRKSTNPNIQPSAPGYFMAAEQVELIDQPKQLDRSMGDVHAAGNPHVHLSPNRLIEIAKRLASTLQKIDTQHANDYQENLTVFLTSWQDAMTKWRNKALPLKGKRAVVHHKDWNYFFEWLEIETVAMLEPKPGIPPSASHLAKLKTLLNDKPVDFIVHTAYQSRKASNWLSEKTNVPTVQLAFTVGGSENTLDLFTLYDDMIETLLNTANQ